MSQTRKSRSVKATQEGIQKLQQAKAAKRNDKGKPWTYFDVAVAAKVDEKTVQRFFRGEGKDRDYVIAIVQALGLEVTEIVAPNEWNPPIQTSEALNWRDICSKILAKQREKQLFRRSITGRNFGHEAKNVYVKLGLVKAKEQPQRDEDSQPSAEKGMLQYELTEKEIEQEYKYDEFLEQVIGKKEKNFAIVGEPGAGKSTWLEQIARYIENSEKGFPICISLASLGGKTLEEYLLQIWLEDALPFISPNTFEVTPALKNKLKELFNSGQAWLLLDGVDEMRIEGYEAPLQTISNQLRGWVDQARVVLTCRLNIWEANPNVLPNFETYRTLHFDNQQVGEFIEQWFTQEGDPESGKKLQNKLSESGRERIRDLIKNPLRLAMLCGIWYFHQGDLPKTKAALYQQYIKYFYQWKPHPQLTNDLDKQEELHTALSKLALEAIDKKLPLREKFVHQTIGQFMFKLARDVGWLNWVYKDSETGEDVYAFYHLTFQEYFAACGIDDWDYFLPREHKDKPVEDKNYPGKYKPYRIFEPQWKEVILLWLGRDKTEVPDEHKEAFIQTLIQFEDGCMDFYRYQAYFIGAIGVSEFKDCSKVDEIVSQIVKWGFGYFNIDKHGWQTFLAPIAEGARATIPETNRTKAITALVELINHCQNKYTRNRAAKILRNIDPENSTASTTSDKLINVYHDISEDIIQSIHSEEIYQEEQRDIKISDSGKSTEIEKLTQVATLVERIKNCQDEFTCWLAADNLVAIDSGNINALDALEGLINNYQNQTVFSFAVHSLGKVSSGNPTAITILVELINNSQDSDIRKIAVHSLGKVGSSNPTTITTLVKLIVNSQEQDIRSLAVYNLKENLPQGQIKEVVTTLKDYLSDETYENDSRRYCDCYSVIWHCAQNMIYPDFHQAWHQTTIEQRR